MPKPNKLVGIDPEILLTPLPSYPAWVDEEIRKVATKDGKPMFRIVDGQRELAWRCGKKDIKHLLKHDTIPAYVPVLRKVFRRKFSADNKYKFYTSKAAADADTTEGLYPEVDWAMTVQTRGVGMQCWVVEVYISPDDLGGPLAWEQGRYADMQIHGVVQKVDVLGEFPRQGLYKHCFSVLDEEGNAIPPGQRTIDECKKRWRFINEERNDLWQEIQEYENRYKDFERKQVERLADNVYQYHGIAARRFHGGEVSKPITKVYE